MILPKDGFELFKSFVDSDDHNCKSTIPIADFYREGQGEIVGTGELILAHVQLEFGGMFRVVGAWKIARREKVMSSKFSAWAFNVHGGVFDLRILRWLKELGEGCVTEGFRDDGIPSLVSWIIILLMEEDHTVGSVRDSWIWK